MRKPRSTPRAMRDRREGSRPDPAQARPGTPPPITPPTVTPLTAHLDPELLIEWIPSLRAFARTLTREPADADDLVQETLCKAILNKEKFVADTNLRAWLFTILKNSFYNSRKRAAREQVGASECASELASVPATQEWSLHGRDLVNAIQRLPPHYRDTLVLVLMQGESYEASARICNCTIGTVKSRVNRARAMVIAGLEEVRPTLKAPLHPAGRRPPPTPGRAGLSGRLGMRPALR